MVYLEAGRLHFAGKFRANVSTRNNTRSNFGSPVQPGTEGWNPAGGGEWQIFDCKITGGVYADGTSAINDPAIGYSVLQSRAARLVDLDTQQQLVSEIYGLSIAVGAPGQPPIVRGTFDTAPFADIWRGRFPPGSSPDATMSAAYQSTLSSVQWQPSSSRLLSELQDASAAGKLSIKFVLDGFNQSANNPSTGEPDHLGRIVGTIGPAQEVEPQHFVLGRQCLGEESQGPWHFAAIVDEMRGKLIADFGNSLRTTSLGGSFDPNDHLEMVVLVGSNQFISLGPVPIEAGNWYDRTAAICEFPEGRALTANERTALATNPIGVLRQTAGGWMLMASEGGDGRYVRADYIVHRMRSSDVLRVGLTASRFGKVLPGAVIETTVFAFDGFPASSSDLTLPANVTTDAFGRAELQLVAGRIPSPSVRGAIDGRVFLAKYQLTALPDDGYRNQNDWLSVLIWSDYALPSDPNWLDDVSPIFTQYAKLYPVMGNIAFDMSDYAQVVGRRQDIEHVFNLPQTHPAYMPVTRDLSPVKREMILDWLQTTGNQGLPNYGPNGAPDPSPPPPETGGLTPPVDPDTPADGKSTALRRRPVLAPPFKPRKLED